MMKLTGNKRTILKSRVRSHPGADVAHASLNLTDKISNLTVSDLVQLATVLGIDCPTDNADAAYTAAKAAGVNTRGAMQQANALDYNAHPMAPQTDEDEAEDEAEDAATDANTPQNAPTTAEDAEPMDTATKTQDKAAADAVSAVLSPMGRGDMVGFQTALQALAVKATTPPAPAPVAQYFDASKVKGHCPKVTRPRLKMLDAEIAASCKVNLDAAALDAYDAPDAPQIDPAYVWPEGTSEAIAALGAGLNVFLWGPAGTGKTSFAKQLAAHYGRPFARISCDDQTESTTLLGMTVPDGQGGVKWQDGQLAAAIRRPGTVVLIDEPTVARAGAHYVFNALLDDERAIVSQETGERIAAAPGVIVIVADNTNGTGDETGAYEGTRRMSRALLDRFALTMRLDYMPAAQEAQTVAKKTGLKPAHALTLAKFAASTRIGAEKGEVSHGLGIRRLFALGSLIRAGAEPARAFQYAVIETAPFEDRETLRQLWTAQVTPGAFK